MGNIDGYIKNRPQADKLGPEDKIVIIQDGVAKHILALDIPNFGIEVEIYGNKVLMERANEIAQNVILTSQNVSATIVIAAQAVETLHAVEQIEEGVIELAASIREITVSPEDPSPDIGKDGDIWIKFAV